VLFDHAPSAMLSAMTLGIPGFNIGSGFMVPQQNQNPMPSLQPWAAISDQARFDKDRAVLQSINQVLTDFNFDPLERVNQLFGASRSLLMTWPELDHYPQRSGDTYHGPVLESQRGAVVDAWANSSDPRVFIYLSASYKPSQRLFEQLRGKPYSVLAHVRDNSAIQVDNARYNNIFLSSRPLDLHQVLPNTDLAITHGGQTTSALALKHGIPMLLLPQHLEQAVLAHRLAKQRLASSLWLPDVNTDWCQVVNSALGSGAVKQNLQSFRQKYQAHDSEQTAASIAQIINQSL
jgi:UDP:flavonoid glycosyltransferase YjiC (YdhE family)